MGGSCESGAYSHKVGKQNKTMSHYTCVAIPGRGGSLDRLMERYDENLVVPRYQKKCGCATHKHNLIVSDKLAEKFGADYIEKKRAEAKEDWTDEQWKASIAPYLEERERLLKEPEPSPDAECEDCQGSGLRWSDYNPDSKWDWFQIGGRWSGEFGGKNESTVGEILACGKIPFAIVTPDGWAERGSMGWFGFVTDEKSQDEWDSEARSILSSLDPSLLAFVLDCHI